MVHSPDIEAKAGKQVHGRILALPRHRQVVAGTRRIRGSMDEKEHRLLLGRSRRDALPIEREPRAFLAPPVFARLDIRLCFGLGAGHKADDARPCSRDDGAARDLTHGFLLRSGPTIANRAMGRQYLRHDSALEAADGFFATASVYGCTWR